MFVESIIVTNFLQTILHNHVSDGALYYFMSGFEYYFRNMLTGLIMSFYLVINFEKYHIGHKLAWLMTLFSGRRNILDNMIYSQFGFYPDTFILIFVYGLYTFRYMAQNKHPQDYMFENDQEPNSESTNMSSDSESAEDNEDNTEVVSNEADDEADDEADETHVETKEEYTKKEEAKEEPHIQRQVSLTESVKCDEEATETEEFENIPSEE